MLQALRKAKDSAGLVEDVDASAPDPVIGVIEAVATTCIRKGFDYKTMANRTDAVIAAVFDLRQMLDNGTLTAQGFASDIAGKVAKLMENRGTGPRGFLSDAEVKALVSKPLEAVVDKVTATRIKHKAEAWRSDGMSVLLAECGFSSCVCAPGLRVTPLAARKPDAAQADVEAAEAVAMERLAAPVRDELHHHAGVKAGQRSAPVNISGVRVGPSGDGKSTVAAEFYRAYEEVCKDLGVAVNILRSYTNSSKLAMFVKDTGDGSGGYMPDEFVKAVAPLKTLPGVVAATSANRNYTQTLQDILDFVSPAVGGGGSVGVSADRVFSHPNSFFSTLVRENAKCWLYNNQDGSFFRLLKTVAFAESTFGDLKELDSSASMSMFRRKLQLMYAAFQNPDMTIPFESEAQKYELAVMRELLSVLRTSGDAYSDPLIPGVLKFRHFADGLAFHIMACLASSISEICVAMEQQLARQESRPPADEPDCIASWKPVVEFICFVGATRFWLYCFGCDRILMTDQLVEFTAVSHEGPAQLPQPHAHGSSLSGGLPSVSVETKVGLILLQLAESTQEQPGAITQYRKLKTIADMREFNKALVVTTLNQAAVAGWIQEVERLVETEPQAEEEDLEPPRNIPRIDEAAGAADRGRGRGRGRGRPRVLPVRPPPAPVAKKELQMVSWAENSAPIVEVPRSGASNMSLPSVMFQPMDQWPESDFLESVMNWREAKDRLRLRLSSSNSIQS